jgi:transketolase
VEGATYPWGKAQVLREGSDVVLVGTGVLVSKAIEAGKILAERGVSATVIGNPFVNRPDVAVIGEAVRKAGGRLVTIEDHQVVGGMGAQLSHALSNAGIAHRVRTLGIPGEFGQSAYLAEELYRKYDLTGPKMAEAALALLGR